MVYWSITCQRWVLFSSTVLVATPRAAWSENNGTAAAGVRDAVRGGGGGGGVGGKFSDSAVPRILHQTWKDENVPEKWKEAQVREF